MRSRILWVKGANPLNEGLHATLLEYAHEGGLQSLAGIGWDLGDGGLGAGALLDVAASDLLELEVAGDVGGDEDVGQLARGHEELGNEVNVPVVGTAVSLPWLLSLVVVAVLLEQLRRVWLDKDGVFVRDVGGYRLEVYGCGLSVRSTQLASDG